MEVRVGHRKTRDDFVLYCPIELAKGIKKGIEKGKYQMTNLGLEKQCSHCKEFWPADSEFFYPQKGKGLHCYCKACYRYKRYLEKKHSQDAA
ncbi:hypothetical protein AVO42_00365 [Thiomicrospira sp. XS5]|uniref:hypothetical protein n=1 Tax=Thiomicrospira sp. XS5 TaxID=1775636 RepID=UPI00074973DF|nr:hypothetical protein [Thiomicrospira sp. XS5]KUJ73909.1 hypothetical protein AVO42_00365 [Thiomicrospira sp. XS5]